MVNITCSRKRAFDVLFGRYFSVWLMVLLIVGLSGCSSLVRTGPDHADKSTAATPAGIVLIGEVEPVTIQKVGLTMPARIDTGAETSSLTATDIVLYERDSKRWVKFTVKDPKSKKAVKMESKLTRIVNIKSHGAEPEDRPVVTLRSLLGSVDKKIEFSLTDRSAFQYPILIGRNFLDGNFIVDISRKNVTSPMNEGDINEK